MKALDVLRVEKWVEEWARAAPEVAEVRWRRASDRDSDAVGSRAWAELRLEGEAALPEAFDRLAAHLGQELRFRVARPGMECFWVGPSLLRLQVSWTAQTHAPDDSPTDPAAAFFRFLLAFEDASDAHRRGDGLQCHWYHAIAVTELARALAGSAGMVFDDLPEFFLPTLSAAEQRDFRELHGELYMVNGNDLKRRVYEVLRHHWGHLASRVPWSWEQTSAFLIAVMDRDFLLNFRDLADRYGGLLRRGVVFRTSYLARWKDDPRLRPFLKDRTVRTIIDFRHPEEIEKGNRGYPPDLLEDIRLINLPLSAAPVEAENAVGGAEMGRHYLSQAAEFGANAVQAMELIAAEDEGGVAVHCHAGKDRTGWFCALLAEGLGMKPPDIVDDFLASGAGVRAEAISVFLEGVKQQGGARTLLQVAGMKNGTWQALEERLLA